jgi:hypothetical protein
LTDRTEELGENPVLVPLCPLQVSHGLTIKVQKYLHETYISKTEKRTVHPKFLSENLRGDVTLKIMA